MKILYFMDLSPRLFLTLAMKYYIIALGDKGSLIISFIEEEDDYCGKDK